MYGIPIATGMEQYTVLLFVFLWGPPCLKNIASVFCVAETYSIEKASIQLNVEVTHVNTHWYDMHHYM